MSQINTPCWDVYLKRVRAATADMSELPIRLCGILTLLHMSKYYALLLHFKLKHKKLSRSIYNAKHQILFPLNCCETEAWKLENTRVCQR